MGHFVRSFCGHQPASPINRESSPVLLVTAKVTSASIHVPGKKPRGLSLQGDGEGTKGITIVLQPAKHRGCEATDFNFDIP